MAVLRERALVVEAQLLKSGNKRLRGIIGVNFRFIKTYKKV